MTKRPPQDTDQNTRQKPHDNIMDFGRSVAAQLHPTLILISCIVVLPVQTFKLRLRESENVKHDQALLVLLTIVLISEARYCTQPSKKWHKVQNSCTSLLRLLQNAHRVAVVFLTRSDEFNETVHVLGQYKQGPRALKMCVDGWIWGKSFSHKRHTHMVHL